MTATRRWQPAWLLISVVGVIVAYRAAMDSMPPCDCFEWKYLAMSLEELVVPFATAALLVIVGIVASFGAGDGFIRFSGAVLPRLSAALKQNTRSPKVRWALGLAALVWMPVFLWGCGFALTPSSGNPSLSFNEIIGEMVMLGAVVAYLATAGVLWLVMFIVGKLMSNPAR